MDYSPIPGVRLAVTDYAGLFAQVRAAVCQPANQPDQSSAFVPPASHAACAGTAAHTTEQAVAKRQILSSVAARPADDGARIAASNCLRLFVADVDAAGDDMARSFAALSTAEVAALCASPEDIAVAMDTWFYLHDDTNALRYLATWRVLQSALRVDCARPLLSCAPGSAARPDRATLSSAVGGPRTMAQAPARPRARLPSRT